MRSQNLSLIPCAAAVSASKVTNLNCLLKRKKIKKIIIKIVKRVKNSCEPIKRISPLRIDSISATSATGLFCMKINFQPSEIKMPYENS